MARVGIIIPAFNAAHYLPFALESVASQIFQDWQILLVDDGSTDNTAQVIAPFLARFGPNMKYLRQENRGLPAARNAAIRASTTEFLALLDADDVWLPCRLSESMKALSDRKQAGISYGLITTIDHEGRIGSTWAGNPKHAYGQIAPQIYMRKVDLPCPTIMFRRKCLDEVGLFDETMRAAEDRDLWLRIALRYEVAFVPKVIAYYRQSPNSMSSDPHRMLQAQLNFIRKHYGAEGCNLRSRQVAMARSYKQFAEGLKLRGQATDALRNSLQAVMLYPFSMDNYRTAASLFLNWIGSFASR
jgi:glycosyltransferase involved in cell wall biosynthesis